MAPGTGPDSVKRHGAIGFGAAGASSMTLAMSLWQPHNDVSFLGGIGAPESVVPIVVDLLGGTVQAV